jgi:hypothetical protein
MHALQSFIRALPSTVFALSLPCAPSFHPCALPPCYVCPPFRPMCALLAKHAFLYAVHSFLSLVPALTWLVEAFVHPFRNSSHHRPHPLILYLRLGGCSEDRIYKGEGSFMSPLLLHLRLCVLGLHCGLFA